MRSLRHDGHSLRTIGRHFRRASGCVAHHLSKKLPDVVPKENRPVSPEIQLRRNRVVQLAKRRKVINGVEEPVFGGAQTIADALFDEFGTEVSASTVRNDLHVSEYNSYSRPKITALPTDTDARMRFATTNSDNNARNVIFVDETMLNTNTHHGRREWRKRTDKKTPRINSRWPKGRAHCFCAIGVGFKKILVLPEFNPRERGPNGRLLPKKPYSLTGERYRDKCLKWLFRAVPGLVGRNGRRPTKVLAQDGAGCHTSAVVTEYLNRRGVRTLENWPARSPDLNMIETCFANLQRRVSKKHPSDRKSLVKHAKKAWKEMPQREVDALVKLFPERCKRVVANGGQMS